MVIEHLAKNIRDGSPHQTLEQIVAMPEELEDLYNHIVARIDSEYSNEAHIIFQMVLCSVEPLTPETLFHASAYASRLYLDGDRSDEITVVDPDQSLRWLMSREGGILEVSMGTSTSLPFVESLHQTAKEYLQSSRARLLMNRVAAPFAAKSGSYFLALCAQSYAYWVADIKKRMLYYLKLIETDCEMDGKILMPIDFDHLKEGPSKVHGSSCDSLVAPATETRVHPYIQDRLYRWKRQTVS